MEKEANWRFLGTARSLEMINAVGKVLSEADIEFTIQDNGRQFEADFFVEDSWFEEATQLLLESVAPRKHHLKYAN